MISPILPILTYHSIDTSGSVLSVSPHDFADQMACVAELGFRGITLDEAVSYRELTGRWPKDIVVITFDDGYANFYHDAMPELARHGFAATVFLVSGHMGGSNNWETPPYGLGTRAILNRRQAEELATCGIEFGSHTRTHPDLSRLSDSAMEEQIIRSRLEIEEMLGKQVESFAYPYGVASQASIECVRKEFRAACTTVLRRVDGDPLHALPRVDVYYLRQPLDFERLLCGRLDYYLSLRRWGRSLRRMLPTQVAREGAAGATT